MSGHACQGYTPQAYSGGEGSSAGALVPHGYFASSTTSSSSEETTPLLPGKNQRATSRDAVKFMLYGILALFVSANLYLHFANCPLYPETMNAIRKGWQREVAEHGVVRDEWQLEQQRHVVVEREWKLQVEWHEKEVARWIREENERQERTRNEWAQETQKHAREAEEYERAVARRVREEKERQERVQNEWAQRIKKELGREEEVRREWAHEVEQHRREFNEMMRRERIEREAERQRWEEEIEERERREEEERQQLRMYWGNVEANKCTTYATREYTAQLMNLPTSWKHRVEACKATPLDIHGISHLPSTCDDRGPGMVIGRWESNKQQPDCATFWESYNDKGCTSPGSGKKYITHKLENLPSGSDWREFCATTPIQFNDMRFPGAQECFSSVWGIFGQWEIDDSSC